MISHFFRNGIENLSVIFTKPDKRTSWEESFNEAKQKLGECAVDFILRRISLLFLNPVVYGVSPVKETRGFFLLIYLSFLHEMNA
jgi:hypothetical protein